MKGAVRASILFSTLILLPALVAGQDLSSDSDPEVDDASRSVIATAVRVDEAPTIDGTLTEAFWRGIPAMRQFVQREPADGSPASEPTEVRVAFDENAVYVGVWAFDSQASNIVPGEAIRDYEVTDADAVLLIFDTYQDQQNGFVFGTTPVGIEYDGQVANQGSGGGFFLGGGGNNQRRFQAGAGGGFNKNWDGSWEVATSQDDEGWYAEFRIPFSTLRYGQDNEAWGFNVSRRVRRLNEESFWSPVPREFNLYRLDFAGTLEGMDPPFKRLATVTPYVLASTARDYAAGQTAFDEDGEIGGEAKIQVTQGLTLDLTVNTDFAQVEVDDQQVNLTRFSLLFPEKRPFFLENAGLFAVGGGGADLFFSRRIGISDGQPVPITGGGRLSGKAAGLNVGLLHIQTGGLDDGVVSVQPENAYSVARVAKELPNRSRIGGIFINRDGELSGDYNRTYAVDGSLGIGEQFTLTSFLAQTETPGLSGAETAWDVTAGWSSRNFRSNATVREIGENFNPEVGFLPRDGHRYYQLFGMYYIRPSRIFRELRPHVSYFTYRSRRTGVETGFEESGRWHIDNHWTWPNGTELHTGANWVREGLYEDFTVPGTEVTVPTGTYDNWEGVFVFNTNRSAGVVLDSRFTWGGFLSGDRWEGQANLTFRQGARFSTTLRMVYNDVTLPEGTFTTTLAGVNFGYFFTPRIYVQSLVQYSDQLDTWSANARFGWLNTAGTGLFIVYNEVQGVESLTGPLGRSLFIKFTRQFNVFGA